MVVKLFHMGTHARIRGNRVRQLLPSPMTRTILRSRRRRAARRQRRGRGPRRQCRIRQRRPTGPPRRRGAEVFRLHLRARQRSVLSQARAFCPRRTPTTIPQRRRHAAPRRRLRSRGRLWRRRSRERRPEAPPRRRSRQLFQLRRHIVRYNHLDRAQGHLLMPRPQSRFRSCSSTRSALARQATHGSSCTSRLQPRPSFSPWEALQPTTGTTSSRASSPSFDGPWHIDNNNTSTAARRH